ncbi:hypothetical protein Nepgr_005872 [Nepenthes gracilis]|uniref:BZIP domain-containing protein n=1 Tax=Nepenthes gracilis TaxID=150966 RepID=A0AAD3XGV6_NEPGR|nr:hypothetical protein Nepgr_005872 [Nepenthes gracilis]
MLANCTSGGFGKDFGSMNMDELLKNIWSVEDTQNMSAVVAVALDQEAGNQSGGYLQRQGSPILPRTLSQKTVDDVWREMSKEYVVGKDDGAESNMTQKQQTLGEMTLEEFLVRAGVVREDTQLSAKPIATEFFGNLTQPSNNTTGFGIDFQQPSQGVGLMGNQVLENNNQISMQSPNLPLNVNGVRSSPQQPTPPQLPQQQQLSSQQLTTFPKHATIYDTPPMTVDRNNQLPPQQLTTFPKHSTITYTSPMTIASNGHLGGWGIVGGTVGLADPAINCNLVQRTASQGRGMPMAGLRMGVTGIATGSPATLSSDRLAESNGHTPLVSPVPCNGGLRGRKYNTAVEKVIERRQRRMIKNRESAARSRLRKQAYTMELEYKIAQLKEENQELWRKQAEIMEVQKNQALEMTNVQHGVKNRCLRRTGTGPW